MQPKPILCVLVVCFTALANFANAQFSAVSTVAGTISTSATAGGTNWSNTVNVQSANGAYATSLITGSNKPTYNLDAKNWGFQNSDISLPNYVPSGSTINGIEVTVIMRKTGTGTLKDSKVMLLKAGSETGITRARPSTNWPSVATAVTYGTSTDLWGATLAGTDILNSGFGVRIVARNQGGRDVQAEIDHIKIKVYFNLTYYYSKSSGDISLTATWGRNSDGTGAAPVSFLNDGQIFFLRNQAAPTLTSALTISGIASKLVVGDSTNSMTFSIPSTYAYVGPLDLSPNANVTVTNAVSPEFGTISDNTTVTFNGASQNVYGTTYYNLTLSGSGTKTLVNGISGITFTNNNFSIGSGVLFNNSGIDITVAGTSTGITNNGTLTGSGMLTYSLLDVSTSIAGNGTYSNLEINAATSTTAKTITLSGAVIITDTFLLTDGTVANGSNLTMAAGSAIVLADGTLGSSLSSSGYDVVYTAFTGTSKTTANELTGTLRSVIVQSGSGTTITLNRNLVLTGDLTLTSGSFDPSATNYNITLGGNYTNNATLVSRNITFTFNGSSAQSINASAALSFYRLTMNGAGGVTLNTPVSVTNTFTLTNGLLTSSSTNKITINSTATISGGSSSSYVDGPLVITLASTSSTTKAFPVGKNGAYRPTSLTITQSTAASTTYTAEIFSGSPTSRTLPAGLYSVSSVRYWNIECSNSANVSSVFVRLEYGSDDNVADPTTIKIAKSSGSNWINLGGLGSAAGSGFINATSSFNTFSDFVIASSQAPSVLPVKWVTFTGSVKDEKALLKWETMSETNTNFYEVLRSNDGIDWKVIGQVAGKNESKNEYGFTDNDPSLMNFYRIKETDRDGRFSYSAVITLGVERASTLVLQPNPSINHQFSCRVDDAFVLAGGQVQVSLIDMMGRQMLNFTTSPKQLIPINASALPSGKYYVIIRSGARKLQSSVVLR
jgi:trimeric autotransporter adhesin